MSRKPTRGYFVRGHFVAEGSELDQELKRDAKGGELSKTDLKKLSERLQNLGEQLLTLPAGPFDRLGLDDRLVDSLAEARRITNFEGRRRQMQYIGKLMRKLPEDTIAAIEAAIDEQHRPSAEATLQLHQAEQWRDRLIADDEALTAWLALDPEADVQQLRTLIRQARKDAQAVKERPGEAQRHGRAYRDIFQHVKAALARGDGDEPGDKE
jgi:ribosome-associated protein